MGTATNRGCKSNQKRGAKEVDEVDQAKKTEKKQKLDRYLFEEQSRPETSEASSSSWRQELIMTMPLSPKTAIRAAKIRIRFADTIVKAKDKTQLDKSSNRTDAMMRIQKEKQLLVRRQREEIDRIKAETRAARLNVRRKERLALEKYEEEAKSNIEDNLASEKEIVKLCGGSRLARIRWVKKFGLFLRMEESEVEEV